MKSKIPHSGSFFDLILVLRDEETAKSELQRAAEAILAEIPEAEMSQLADYLNSRYGEMCAREVLEGVPVCVQIEQRRGRFIRHFNRVVGRAK